jgi:outer membrane protein assembly factor BamB
MVDIDGNMLLSADKTLYVGSYQGQLIALDINTKPQVKWQQSLSSYQALSESQSAVYAVDANSHVIAFDKQTGKVIWKQQDLAWRGLSRAVTLDERLFVGDKDGYVHIIAQENGKLLGRFKVKGAVVDLAIFNQQLWVYTQKGQLSVWSLSK